MSMKILLPFCFLFILYFGLSNSQCGRLERCDKLVSVYLFQDGVCGRAARCNWELLHLEKYLLGDTSNEAKYESLIKTAFCYMPVFLVQSNLTKDEDIIPYNPCGSDGEYMMEREALQEKYKYFPMPSFYLFQKSGEFHYLNRTEQCRQIEKVCLKTLNHTIVSMCTNDVTLDHLKKIEENIHFKLRGKRGYDYLHGKNETKLEALAGGNKCLFRSLVHERTPPVDQYSPSRYRDKYDVLKTRRRILYHKQALQIRPPYYDLYTLYLSDPRGKFAIAPEEERWWNETKAYSELAHYLPENIINASTLAIQCVYDKVLSEDMVWNPEKFCWTSTTFICVQLDRLKGNTCEGIEQLDQVIIQVSNPIDSEQQNP